MVLSSFLRSSRSMATHDDDEGTKVNARRKEKSFSHAVPAERAGASTATPDILIHLWALAGLVDQDEHGDVGKE